MNIYLSLLIYTQLLSASFTFNMSTDGGSNYNVTKTTTFFRAYHAEAGTDTILGYATAL
jgi:hypothetical protein